jgi:hypothetical protein
MNPLKKRPWLLVIMAFVLLIGAWTAFIMIAVKNQPTPVPLEEAATPAENA